MAPSVISVICVLILVTSAFGGITNKEKIREGRQYVQPDMTLSSPYTLGVGSTLGSYSQFKLHLTETISMLRLQPNLKAYAVDQELYSLFPPLGTNSQFVCDTITTLCAYYYY